MNAFTIIKCIALWTKSISSLHLTDNMYKTHENYAHQNMFAFAPVGTIM